MSVLDVDAVGVINGIYDLWLMMGAPQSDTSDGYIHFNSDLIQVYELDLNTGHQTLWKDVSIADSALEITTDQNRLFVLYLFGDEAAAQSAPQVFP
jgi:Zn-dependent M28 family amino/carboxypeptidase